MDQVNKELIPVKAHYFLYNAATGPIVPFLPTISKQLGFSGSLVGVIYLILPIFGLIAKPLFCGIADKFKLHKVIFILFQVVFTLGFLIIYFIPEVEPSAKVKFHCNKRAAFEQINLVNDSSLIQAFNHAYSNNTFIDCQMSCQSTKTALEQICQVWRVFKYCDDLKNDNSKDKTIDFMAKFNMYKTIPLTDSWFLRLENVTFSDGIPRKIACEKEVNIPCSTKCAHDLYLTKILKTLSLEEESFSEQASSYQFHLFLFAAITSWVGMAVVVSVSDTICFSILGEQRRHDYGKQKMWGSIGFGIFGISAGYLIDILSIDKFEKDYTIIFFIMTTAMVCDVIVSLTIKQKTTVLSEPEPSIIKELYSVGKEPAVLVFAFWCIGVGMCTGVIWNFLFWYTEDIAIESQRSRIKTVQGLLIGIQCFIGEMPFNFAFSAILKKLGHVNVMSLVLLVFSVRFMAYSVISNIWLFLLVEILHGPSYGICWPAMVSYGEKVAPPGTKATMQGLVGAIFEGIGVSLGSLICGYLFVKCGGVTTFRIFAGGTLAWLAIYWILQIVLRRVKSYPLSNGHSHLQASYMPPADAMVVLSEEMMTY